MQRHWYVASKHFTATATATSAEALCTIGINNIHVSRHHACADAVLSDDELLACMVALITVPELCVTACITVYVYVTVVRGCSSTPGHPWGWRRSRKVHILMHLIAYSFIHAAISLAVLGRQTGQLLVSASQ